MKKAICLLLALLLATVCLSACEKKDVDSAFTARNEIITYRKLDPNKTQIVVSHTGNIETAPLIRAFEQKNPDVQVVSVDITGGVSGCTPLVDWVTRGYAPDVVISAADFFSDELTPTYFTNLSANPALEYYESDALNRVAIDANLYWLPGPSNLTAMMYNKTLFERYGWQVPQTFDEFIKLCVQIRKETGGRVEAWNPNAKYSNELLIAMEAFTYEELFGGVDNRAWYENLTKGQVGFVPHMQPYYNALETLIENGILRKEHFTYSATARAKEFAAGRIAMANMNVYNADTHQFDFGMMPFPTTKGDVGYLCGNYSCYIGVPKKERTDKQTEAVNRFLLFFSSPEGQRAYIGDSMKLSHVKGMPINQTDGLAELLPAIQAGHSFFVLDFASEGGAACAVSLHQAAMDMAAGTRTKEECVAAADTELYGKADGEDRALPETVAVIAEDMTVLDTSFYIADAYRAAARADVGLLANGAAYRGNLMRLFAGKATPALIAALKPRAFANGSALLKLAMTGQQLIDALNHPLGENGQADCVYAFSGLVCQVAPWNEAGRKVLSVKLADGADVDPQKRYTVAAWEGTVADEYITHVLAAIDGSFESILTAKMKADETVAPANDGRIELVWE